MKKIEGRFLYYLSQNEGLFFRDLSFYKTNLRNGKAEFMVSLPVRGLKKLLSRYRLTNRLFRLEPKCAGRLSENRYVIALLGALWLLETRKKSIEKITEVRKGFSVLNFCECNDALYFGDYGVNKDHEIVNVYKLDQNLELTQLYTFPKGSIRHIHNIINDEENGRLWVLTGDNEPDSGIYLADYDFSTVVNCVKGKQEYRAVVGFPYKKGLLYATDSVENINNIYWLDQNLTLTKVSEINGSCIYGTEMNDRFIYSTTVEPMEGGSMFSYRLGGGIKSRYLHIVSVAKDDLTVKILTKYKKDIWPMKLFQYGRMTFPGGQKNYPELWAYNIACKHVDGKTIRIDNQ